MAIELAPESYSAPDRPPVITLYDGTKIYLHIHDAAYMRERNAWKKRLADAHPDGGGSPAEFRRLILARSAWQKRECMFYARLGMLPPDGKVIPGIINSIRRRRALAGRKEEE